MGVLRFAGGAVLLLPLALIKGEQWPGQRDWPAVIGLALLFFVLFPVLFNAALIYTTAARGALPLSTTPLITMLVAALLRIEPLTARRSLGLVLAMGGVTTALAASLSVSPLGALRGGALWPPARGLAPPLPPAGRGRLYGPLYCLVTSPDRALRADCIRSHGYD